MVLVAAAAGAEIGAAAQLAAETEQLARADGGVGASVALDGRRALKQLGAVGAVAGLGAGLIGAGAGAALGVGAGAVGLGLSGLNAVVPIGGGAGNLLAGAVPFVLRTGSGAAGGAVNAGLGLLSIVNPTTYLMAPVRAAPRRNDCVVYTVSGQPARAAAWRAAPLSSAGVHGWRPASQQCWRRQHARARPSDGRRLCPSGVAAPVSQPRPLPPCALPLPPLCSPATLRTS
jgi:hypothetical protein